MKVNVLHEGDRVLNVTNEFVAVERVSGEVDILPLIKEEGGMRIDTQHILTIGYGNNTIQIEAENGLTIINFSGDRDGCCFMPSIKRMIAQ